MTGGTGSFGTAFATRVLSTLPVHSLRILSRDEWKQWNMQRTLNDDRLRFLLGDVRDRNRLYRALDGVDIVIHAAALKQVPLCEYNPMEAINTNILGAANLIDAAIDRGVERVLALSTDKAASPTNLYGATKLCAEKLFIQANSYAGTHKTRFACCRYGNVLGSRGSVVLAFLEQREGGTLTVTDERMSRFWITLPQAVEFVLRRVEEFEGGEIFVPKLPSVRIGDIARAVAPEARIDIAGIRPGEKLSEVMITEHEAPRTFDAGDYFVMEPEHHSWGEPQKRWGKALPDGFEYRSDNNDVWLDSEATRQLLISASLLPRDHEASVVPPQAAMAASGDC